MTSAPNLKILFVINPISGTKAKIAWEPAIRKYFTGLTHSIEFFLLDGKDDASSLKFWIEKLQPERVIAVGGDGTVSLVAEQLLKTNIAMGILPAGSANGMAKELDIPVDVDGALDIILNGHIKLCDVIKINNKEICLHLSDLGVNAQLVKYFEEGNFRGKLGYALKVFKVLWRKRTMDVIIKTDKEELKRRAFMVVIANASKYGTGALINPEGNLGDGLFEIVVVRRIHLISVLKMFLKFKRFNPKKVELFQAETVDIKTTKKSHFQVDGEYLGKVDSVKAEILKSQLKLILPRKS
ncbi:MAG: diacylglycerol/lipid kinase family protein [Chitinophagaceae bacterium]